MTSEQRLLRSAYKAFNARDIDTALAAMHHDVEWQNGMEGDTSTVAGPFATTGRASGT